MDRPTWLREVRRAAIRRYDTLHAPTYDEHDIPMTDVHRRFVERVVAATPPGGVVLDVPCGTGKYFGLVLAAGKHVVGVDQSAGMLEQARRKHPAADVRLGGLQELAFRAEFDGVLCVDSMENVPPEDWPRVAGNLAAAVRSGGLVYVTVEEIDGTERDRAFRAAQAEGLPVVEGEHTARGGGYHYYPEREQVRRWVSDAGLEVIEEAGSPGEGYGYWHLLLRPVVHSAPPQ